MLVDTSVWIEHLRRSDPALVALLHDGKVECHPFIIGELAAGSLHRRSEMLRLLAALPGVPLAEHHEALAFLEAHDLMGRGLGWVDVHLLASAKLGGTPLWTYDRRLREARRHAAVDL
jgi:predicted nucleic acid-binding protein